MPRNDLSCYEHGGLDREPVNVLRLISELEGSYQLLKFMAYDEDMKTLEEIKTRYYKEYFKLLKKKKNENSNT
tara:strand:- start:564 stop:782 length:219 start_codon:yes stop_codon:yes gene_type:complete